MKKDGFCAVYCVVLIVIVAVDNTMALSGPPGSVCGSQCCLGWDQVGDTCMAHCYHPCVHGTCVETNVCKCDPGWGGGDCRHDIDECWYETHVCHHNCHNHDGCYTCSCDDGFQLINSTHCVNSTTANITSTTVAPLQGTTAMASLCTTAATSTVANPQPRTTRPTASGFRTTPTAPTTTAATTTTTAQQTQTTATTTTADIATARRPQRTTRTTASSLHPRSTATTRTTTTTTDITTPRRPQRTTALAAATSTADITPAGRQLRTAPTTTLHLTGPVVRDNDRSPAPRSKTDHRNVDTAIGVAVGAVALLLLLTSLGMFIFCKRRRKAASRQQQQLFSNLSPHPRGSLPGYTDTHWRNPAYENMYEEIPETRSPPPPYEATDGCGATGGFADLAVMSKGRMADTHNVGVADGGMPLAGTIPAVPSKAKENFYPLRNLHVDMQKEPLPEDHGYESLKKVPGNEYESLKRW